MRPIRAGDSGPAVVEIRTILDNLGLLELSATADNGRAVGAAGGRGGGDGAAAPANGRHAAEDGAAGVANGNGAAHGFGAANGFGPANGLGPATGLSAATGLRAATGLSAATSLRAAGGPGTANGLGAAGNGAAGESPATGNANPVGTGAPDQFDAAVERAVRAFQQSRGMTVDGLVGDETWRALDAARWRLGARALYQAVPEPLVGEDVRALQERLLEMGFDVGRADGIYGVRTARAVAQFQREVGLASDGACGPQTMHALRRLGRKVVGGRPQWLREAEAFRHSGPNLVGKTIVIDPGHGGPDAGVVVPDGPLRWNEADLAYDLAARLEGRLGAAGMRVHLTRGPAPATALPDRDRARLANDLNADLLISLHVDGHGNPEADGVATYHYGTGNGVTSTVGERLANLVQREIVVRTGLRDCDIHAKTWDLLRLTRMPAVRVDLGYLTSPKDRERLVNPMFREQVVEAVLAAVQRMYYPVEHDVPTGSIDVRKLRLTVAASEG